MTPSQPSQANAQQRYEVDRGDLPLSCPSPSMALWNSHPRVYLPIEAEGGTSTCPYCGAVYVLVDSSLTNRVLVDVALVDGPLVDGPLVD